MGFLARIKKEKKVFDRAKKEKAPSGYVTDEEILEIFDLKVGKSVQVKAQLRKVEEGEVNDQDILRFRFTVMDGAGKGTPLDHTIWVNDEDIEETFKEFVFILQKLGFDTDELTVSDLEDLVNELNEDKPLCRLSINAYKVKNGKNKGKIRTGLRVVSALSDSEEEVEDDEGESDDVPEYDEEGEDIDEEDSEEEDSESDEEDESDEDDSDDEEGEEGDAEEDEIDEDDPTTWIGYDVIAKPPRAKAKATYQVTKYVKRGNKLICTNSRGAEITMTPEDVIDWA
jgi:hypothetical protein